MRANYRLSPLVTFARSIVNLNPAITQHTFGFFQDDSSDPDTCTQIGTDDSTTESWAMDTNLMVRIGQENTNNRDVTATTRQLQYQVNGTGGTWNSVNTSSNVARIVAGTPTDGTACDVQILDTADVASSGYESGQYDDASGGVAQTHNKDTFWEDQWCLQLRSADLTDQDDVYFRIFVFSGIDVTIGLHAQIKALGEPPFPPLYSHRSLVFIPGA